MRGDPGWRFRRNDFLLVAFAVTVAWGPGCHCNFNAGGCSDRYDSSRCWSGSTTECVGAGDCEGTAECIGGRYGACVCNVDAGPPDGSIDGGPDAGLEDAGPTDASVPRHLFPGRDFVCRAGESPVCSTITPARSREERTAVIDEPLGGRSLTFVVSSWTIEPPGSGMSDGFNLDGLDSGDGAAAGATTCEETRADFAALLDPLHVGVDNAQGGLIPTVEALYDPAECPGGATAGCIDATLAARIAEGSLLLLMYIEDLDSLVNDPEVTVSFYLAEPWAGGTPELDADGRLAADQMLAITSLVADDAPADIFEGRLRVWSTALDFPEGTADGLFLAGNDLRAVEARFDVSLDGLTRGSLGGHAAVEHLVTVLSSTSGSEDTVRTVVEALADIAPSASDASRCTRISVGYALEAVPAVIAP